MNNFKNTIHVLEELVKDYKRELDDGHLTTTQEITVINFTRELEMAILTLESSVDLLNLGSINAINTLQR